MPTYDYVCPDCGPFDALRSLAQRNEDCPCRACGAASRRAFLTAPRLAAKNARRDAAHAPTMSKDVAGIKSHPAGCGCCAGSKRGATVRAPDGAKAFPSKRPWMISH
jgi:putative FmdB family regulatory protein